VQIEPVQSIFFLNYKPDIKLWNEEKIMSRKAQISFGWHPIINRNTIVLRKLLFDFPDESFPVLLNIFPYNILKWYEMMINLTSQTYYNWLLINGNLTIPNSHETSFCVQNRQVFSLDSLNQFPFLRLSLKFVLYRIPFYSGSSLDKFYSSTLYKTHPFHIWQILIYCVHV